MAALIAALLVLSQLPPAPAASVPPLKLNREFTPPRITDDTFVNTPPLNNVTKLFVASAWLPIVMVLLFNRHSEPPAPPPMLAELLLQLVLRPIVLLPVLNT